MINKKPYPESCPNCGAAFNDPDEPGLYMAIEETNWYSASLGADGKLHASQRSEVEDTCAPTRLECASCGQQFIPAPGNDDIEWE